MCESKCKNLASIDLYNYNEAIKDYALMQEDIMLAS